MGSPGSSSHDSEAEDSAKPENGDVLKNGEKLDIVDSPVETRPSANNDEGTESEEDEGEETDSEEEDDEEDDDDEEPALKYERIGGSLPDLLKKDSASALSISKSLLVFRPFPTPFASNFEQGSGHPWRNCTHFGPDWEQNQILQTTHGVYSGYMHG
jgi:hypothetical protein